MSTLAPALTDRQRKILAFIKAYADEHGYPPSVREIRDEIGVASTSTVHVALDEIEATGLIRRVGYRSRGITVVDESAAA